ncbi:hypothetical protein [Rhodoferax sp.]|uniref:hypothetical protein n=1 Tax=Rhodoferax sp. TaxID=50421 RepID=UPI00374D1709
MNVHSATPSSKENRPARNTATRSGAAAYISERNTQAYLLARDTVRRVQRTASLIGEMSQRRAGAA